MAEKRRRARAMGLCITCCRRRAPEERSVCNICAEQASKRTLRRRAEKRSARGSQLLIDAHERAGNQAQEHKLYADAAQWYRAALNLGAITRDDRLRIMEKLAHAYFLGSKPALAQSLLEELADAYNASLDNNEEMLRIFCKIADVLWINAKPEHSLMVLERAIKFINDNGLSLDHRANIDLLRIRYLHVAGRPNEAFSLLKALEESVDIRQITNWRSYCEEKGLEAAQQGRPQEMHAYFKLALASPKKEHQISPFSTTSVWAQYSNAALLLGDVRLVKHCLESALRIARQHQMLWRIPYLCAGYADFLSVIDQDIAAREYLLEALAYDAEAPILEELIAFVGIPIALRLNDTVLLERFEHSIAQSPLECGNTGYINESLAAARALVYASRGEYRRAQALLHRALPSMQRRGWGCWEYTLRAARFGAVADLPLVRNILEQRLALPHCDVARACLSLFDGFVAERNKQIALARSCAMDAVQRFDELHWYGYAKLARTLLPSHAFVSPNTGPRLMPSNEMQAALTSREREVAHLVLKGLTNRVIARELNISPHTVDSHVNSIMNRLGIRSRHQLADAFSQRPEVT